MGNIGMPEMLMIMVIALIIFGPRKLPELGKSLGKGLAQFRKASDDFKRQWEDEVETEKRRIDAPPAAEAARHAEMAAEDYGTPASLEPSPAASGHYSNDTDVHTAMPAVEPASATVPRSEPSIKETKRDWM